MPIRQNSGRNTHARGGEDGQDDEYPDWMLTPKFALVVAIFLVSTLVPAVTGVVIIGANITGYSLFSSTETPDPNCYVRWEMAPLVLGYKEIYRAEKDIETYGERRMSAVNRVMSKIKLCPMQACSENDRRSYRRALSRYIHTRQSSIRKLAQNYGRPGLQQGMDLFEDWQDKEIEADIRVRVQANLLDLNVMKKYSQFLNMTVADKMPTPCIHSQAEPG